MAHLRRLSDCGGWDCEYCSCPTDLTDLSRLSVLGIASRWAAEARAAQGTHARARGAGTLLHWAGAVDVNRVGLSPAVPGEWRTMLEEN